MSPGLIVFLHLLTVPFISEAETLGTRTARIPSFLEVIGLRTTRKTRWFKGYLVLMTIWVALLLAPTKSGKEHDAGILLILGTLVIQASLWIYVIHRIRSSKK